MVVVLLSYVPAVTHQQPPRITYAAQLLRQDHKRGLGDGLRHRPRFRLVCPCGFSEREVAEGCDCHGDNLLVTLNRNPHHSPASESTSGLAVPAAPRPLRLAPSQQRRPRRQLAAAEQVAFGVRHSGVKSQLNCLLSEWLWVRLSLTLTFLICRRG